MQSKRLTKIAYAIKNMNKNDIYSLMLFTLYKLHDDPKYSTLSELSYILDGDNLTKFLSYYGGMTIKIPTLQEFRLVTQSLLLYQYVNLEKGDFGEALKAVCGDEFSQNDVKEIYKKLLDILSKYQFDTEVIS